MNPAQDPVTSDPHADLLARQQKIAAQTAGEAPKVINEPKTEGNDNLDVREHPNDEKPIDELKVDDNQQNIRVNKPSISVNQQNNSANPNSALELMKADIFKLLGMSNITEAEKKKNLDEMEETIWQDFVENDLPEMLKGEQKTRFEELLRTSPSAEKIINFFGNPPNGGLPPDFEQKYLKKTLDFKSEIVKEQIETLLLASEGKDAAKQNLLQLAKSAADSGNWKQVEDLMVKYS